MHTDVHDESPAVQPDMQLVKSTQFASPLQVLVCDAQVPPVASAVSMQLVQADDVEHTPAEQVPPSQELPQVPQSVLEIWRSWQPSEQLVYGLEQEFVVE